MSRSLATLTLALMVLLGGCKDPQLQSASGDLHLDPALLDFGQVKLAHLTLRNDGRAPASLEWTTPASPFVMLETPSLAQSGSTPLTVLASPVQEGPFTASVAFDSNGAHYESELTGVAMAPPPCVPSNECLQSNWDPVGQRCVESAAPDGIGCDATAVCVIGGACQAGRCVGTPKTCDDANACTIDVCNPTTGCEHLPSPPCPGDGACQAGICDPSSGCGLTRAADGTACGPVQTCDAAQICLSGACVMRDPPDGYICAQASPCQGEGRCAGSTCERDLPTTLRSNWNYDSLFSSTDGGTDELHDFVVEAQGAVTLSGFFKTPALMRANTAAPSSASDVSRRCELWNGRLICADFPSVPNGKISALDLSNGAILWTFDIRTSRPDFVALTDTIFMARMAVQGPDRFAALFEAYPTSDDPNATANCRMYFLVVLDGSGNLVSAQQLHDPVLDVCNHPHPYGFAADSLGDLFISFSQTIGTPAPLVPGIDTTVMSFSRDGVFRWKLNDPMLTGGELAVATGLLYPENSPNAIMAATGAPAYSLASPFGRLVVTQERSVPAPVIGDFLLSGYEAGTATQRWTTVLQNGETFFSDQIRLASWKVRDGQRTVALTFTQRDGSTLLDAIDTHDGSLAFSCPIVLEGRSAPQLAELTDGALTVMDGSDACGKCDPPYASSSAAFHTFAVPLLTQALEPWIGTFGGPGHDHREEVLLNTGGSTQ